jgi:hypothetical protein
MMMRLVEQGKIDLKASKKVSPDSGETRTSAASLTEPADASRVEGQVSGPDRGEDNAQLPRPSCLTMQVAPPAAA